MKAFNAGTGSFTCWTYQHCRICPAAGESCVNRGFEDATPETLEQYWRPDFSYLEVNEDPEFAKSGTKA